MTKLEKKNFINWMEMAMLMKDDCYNEALCNQLMVCVMTNDWSNLNDTMLKKFSEKG